uniref:Guanylate-binding protein N-terminal domain-containing protein n=1 Tax=Peronospora matthiolae TaxID=2874970 RepID=A0AAV1VBQ8_9STRA
MEPVRRNVVLVDAVGSLTADGERLLEQELDQERLAIVSFLGPPSTCAVRHKLIAKLLDSDHKLRDIDDKLLDSDHKLRDIDDKSLDSDDQQLEITGNVGVSSGGDGLVLLASVTCIERDFQVLILSFNVLEIDVDFGPLTGAFCALSSLVVSCYDESVSMQCLAPFLPPFQSLFQTLVKDFTTVEVSEILPKMLHIDLSSSHSLAAEEQESLDSVEALASLVRLKRVGVLYPQSVAEMDFDEFCNSYVAVKKLFGLDLTGEMLASLLCKLSVQVSRQDPIDFGTAWDDFVEEKCRDVAKDALRTYEDCVRPCVLEHPPMELNAFKQLHDEIWRLSMDVYCSASKYKSARHRQVRHKLKNDIRTCYETELGVLTEMSRKFCEEIRQTLWTELFTRARDSESFPAMLAAIQDFDKQYDERARGPEKASVLRDFYQQEVIQAFQELEVVVTRQLSESRLKGLRLQLEQDFTDKKEALVEHFRKEEAQLRVRMAQDMETMQKMCEAKTARVNIGGSEVKQLRDEVNEMKRQNAELQEKAIVLEHARQDAITQKEVFATAVDDLKDAVHREMANRTELVETLALTVKSAEENEKMLNEKIAELQVELGEKTFRVEGELHDMTQQLRKTSEEKDELQKKLTDIFLKVTALPEALQQHLFSMDNDSRADFADVLATYMSQ